jgi:hypothetical protein
MAERRRGGTKELQRMQSCAMFQSTGLEGEFYKGRSEKYPIRLAI